MSWTLAAAAAAVVVVLATGAAALRLLHRRRPRRIDSPDEAADAAERALPGFVTLGAVVGADGTAALAVAENGRVAVVKRRGAQLVAGEVGWRSVRLTPAGVLVETGDRRLGTIAVTGIDALDVRRLGPAKFG